MKGEEFTNVNTAIFMHVFNHGTFHRGQVVSMMRNAGYTGQIESTDFISYERRDTNPLAASIAANPNNIKTSYKFDV